MIRHHFAAVLPENHRLAKKPAIRLSSLAKENWVSLSDAFFPGRREFFRQVCARAGFAPNIVSEADTLYVMLGMVTTGEALAILPMHARKLPHTGCVFVKLLPPAPASELLLVLPQRPPEVELATLIQMIVEQAAALRAD